MLWHKVAFILCLAVLPVHLGAADNEAGGSSSPAPTGTETPTTTTTTTTTTTAPTTTTTTTAATTTSEHTEVTTPVPAKSTNASVTAGGSSTTSSTPANPNTNGSSSTAKPNNPATDSSTTTNSSAPVTTGSTSTTTTSTTTTPIPAGHTTSNITNKPDVTTATPESDTTEGGTTTNNETSSGPTTPVPPVSTAKPTNESSTASTASTTTNSTGKPSITSSSTTSVEPSTTNISATTPSPPATQSPTTSTTTSTTTTTTTTVAPPNVKISETNILLVEPGAENTSFVEIKGAPKVDFDKLWLVVFNASEDATAEHLLMLSLNNTSPDDNGVLVIDDNDSPEWTSKLTGLQSVLIALFSDEDGASSLNTDSLLDVLLYSSNETIEDHGLVEKFSHTVPVQLTVDYQSLKTLGTISLSRCSQEESNAAFIVSQETRGAENKCVLSERKPLGMKLTRQVTSCPQASADSFNDTLTNAIVEGVNNKKPCGFGRYMISGMRIDTKCPTDTKQEEISIRFTVGSRFENQLQLVVEGYNKFVNDSMPLKLGPTESFEKIYCPESCIPKEGPPKSKDDDHKIHVTIAVVVSCIGVFLVALLFVVLYMRRKKRGILQFRMTRLDEDEDDLIGDMDDFVGNQGPTFRNFR